MPRFGEVGPKALRKAVGPGPETVLNAVASGCSDAEIAGLMGMTPAQFQAVLDREPAYKTVIAGLRAKRSAALRQKVQDICLDDDHPAQGRILDTVYKLELQKQESEEKENLATRTWAKLAELAGG